jgi:hypothetical protein
MISGRECFSITKGGVEMGADGVVIGVFEAEVTVFGLSRHAELQVCDEDGQMALTVWNLTAPEAQMCLLAISKLKARAKGEKRGGKKKREARRVQQPLPEVVQGNGALVTAEHVIEAAKSLSVSAREAEAPQIDGNGAAPVVPVAVETGISGVEAVAHVRQGSLSDPTTKAALEHVAAAGASLLQSTPTIDIPAPSSGATVSVLHGISGELMAKLQAQRNIKGVVVLLQDAGYKTQDAILAMLEPVRALIPVVARAPDLATRVKFTIEAIAALGPS